MSRQALDDLSRKWAEDMEHFIETRMAIARHVLSGREELELLTRFASDALGTAAATVAGCTKEGGDPAQVFDLTIDSVVQRLRARRPAAIALIHAHRASQSA